MRNEFYVEFGAMDGISGSNTYILEKEFNWTGILCEPSIKYKNSLKYDYYLLLTKICVFKYCFNFFKLNSITRPGLKFQF